MSTLKVNAIEKKDADQTLTVKDATLTDATLAGATLTGTTSLTGTTTLANATITTGNLASAVNLDSVTFPAGHMIGFGSFTNTDGTNITTTGTKELVAETGITMVVKSASSKMLINFFTATAEGDSNRAFFHIRRSINGASATTLRNFGTSEKGHGMSDVDGQFLTVAINDIDTHGQPIGTSIQYYVRLISNGGGTVYWRGGGSNQSGYVMEIQA
jgi:hypothetical protein